MGVQQAPRQPILEADPQGPQPRTRRARPAALPWAPRVGWGADPRATATISWSTAAPVTGPGVEIVAAGVRRFVAAGTRTVPGWAVQYHHAAIEGLEPATTYAYRCLPGAGAGGTFRTAPPGPEAFTFAAYGDQGTDAQARAVMELIQASAPAFVVCLGDLCYADPSGGVMATGEVNHAVWDRWLRMSSRAVASGAALLPVVGNHEIVTGMGAWGYDGFLARVALPPGGPAGLPTTWAARWGNLALVAADSNDVSTEITRNNGVSGGRQDEWLNKTLAALRADPGVDWIVVGFHHSAYCTNSLHGSDGGVRRWVPIFDRHQVDLVVNGHNHCYERTHPMRGGAATARLASGQARWAEGAVTYLCAGGGGGQTGFPMWRQPVSTVTAEGGVRHPEAAPWSAFRYNGHSLVLIDVTPPAADGLTALTVRAVDSAGRELERATLLRRR